MLRFVGVCRREQKHLKKNGTTKSVDQANKEADLPQKLHAAK